MSAEQTQEPLLYQLEAVKNEATKWYDLRVTHLENGYERMFKAIGRYEGEAYFESQLRQIFGSDAAVTGIYWRAERPKMTEAGYERFRQAYATGINFF